MTIHGKHIELKNFIPTPLTADQELLEFARSLNWGHVVVATAVILFCRVFCDCRWKVE